MEPGTVPAWARPLLAEQPQLMAEIAVFRAAHDVDPADTRITGPEQHANRSAAIQQLIHGRVDAALRRGEPGAQRWRSLAETIDPHITADPFWPRLATHLDEAARAGADIAAPAHRGDRPPRSAARRTARRRTVVAAGRHPGTGHPRSRQHRAATGLDTRTAPAARLTASPKPSSPTPRGHRWSPPSPPPAGRRATCSPRPPNTCATSPKPSTYDPTNTPGC